MFIPKSHMANAYHRIYLQTIFAVKYRAAVLEQTWRKEVFRVIGNLINEAGGNTIIVNGIADHVHCFFGLKPAIPVAEIMKAAKATSSQYINDHQLTSSRFKWQVGFGVFPYSQSPIDRVYQYIAHQGAHHQKQDFKAEYELLLKKFNISFDERYVFQDLL